jgi:hypothetical protein
MATAREQQANRKLAAETPQAGESNRIADQESPSPAQVEGDAKPSLTGNDVATLQQLVGEMRSALSQLPGEIVAEVTNLLATVDGHMAANPPNPVATGEALALIRDQLEKCPGSKLAANLSEKSKPVLKRLGETV